MQIAMALDEALLNAMVHGNLEVSSDLRQIDDGKPYVDMIAEKATRRTKIAVSPSKWMQHSRQPPS